MSITLVPRRPAALWVDTLTQPYASLVARLSSWMRPQPESPAESAMRLRLLATRYSHTQPSFAADLYAAADRADEA